MRVRTSLVALALSGASAVAGYACSRPFAPSVGTHARPTGAAPAGVAGERHATLLFFSDAHADLESHPELFWDDAGRTELADAGGYARLAHAARAIRKEADGNTLLIDGGDTFQGSAAATWSRGEVVVAPQRALGVDLGIPGNWEVVYGPQRMKELATATGYPWLAANVVDAKTGALVFAPTAVRSVGGVRFGFVGFTDPDVPVRQSPSFSAGLRFLGPESLAEQVRALRPQVDVVVLVAHLGLARTVDLVEKMPGAFDLVLSGDTHERVKAPIVRGDTTIVEPGAFASMLGRVDVTVVASAKPRFTWQLLELRADRYGEDEDVARVVRAALAPYRARMDAEVARTTTPLERYGVVENSLDDLYVRALKARTGVDVALSNGFRFGHPVAVGPITDGDLMRFFPVDGRLKVGKVSGAQLRAFWESEIEHVFSRDASKLFGGWLPRVAGMRVRFRADAKPGEHVTSIEIGGRALDPAATYTIASCEREGDADDTVCRMKGVAEPRVLDVSAHEVFRDWLREQRSVSAPTDASVVAEELPARVFSQWQRR
jgi:2',3'-cyclic-nucleotide 2'-phosphodiesterase (5'-nucleotidase family)